MSTPDLFGDVNQSVVVIEETLSRPLSPAQHKYNALLAKIEKQKAALEQWQRTHTECQQQVVGKLEPLRETLTQEQIKLVFFLDDALHRYKFSKTQTNQLIGLITHFCEELIEETDDDDFIILAQGYLPEPEPELSAEEQAELDDALRAAFAQNFGIHLDESIDLDDPEAIKQAVLEHHSRQQQSQKPRKKTAKQLTKEAQEKAEAEAAQQSIQSVYRQLVKALHPDRESDADERARKTQLMQAVTVAYEEKNLIKLLELQLQETQISQQLHQLGDDKINAFIKLLDNQLRQLKTETQQIELNYKNMLGLSPWEKLTPKKLHSFLKSDMAQLEQKIKDLQHDRRLFERDIQALKAWLKYFV